MVLYDELPEILCLFAICLFKIKTANIAPNNQMSPNIVILLVDYVDDVIPLPLVFICLYHCRHRKQFFDAINVIVDTIKVRTCMLLNPCGKIILCCMD